MFEGTKVRLRSLELTDLDYLVKGYNDLELRLNTGKAIPKSREELQDLITKSWEFRQNEVGYMFAIDLLHSKEFIGFCSLFSKNRIAKSFDLGIFILDKKKWNKGYGTDAMKVLLKFGFEFLNAHRIELSVYPENERGIHVYEKVGFKQIGRKRQSRFMNGTYRDEILMDILQVEWLRNKSNE